jgi:hypothetical protein
MRRGVDFTHVIMTRFNMPTPGRESQIRSRPGWLAGRFELFERYCLPSIAAQTTRGFHWVVYFDEATPPEFRARIEACRAVFPFEPCFTQFFPAEGWPRSLGEILGQPTPWLLTTRFDSDDALAVDHVARLQAAVEAAAPTARTSFNLTHGVVIEDGRVYAHAHPSNAFASWLEPWDGSARTCMSINHMRMAEQGPILQVGGPAAWLQVVHGGNVSNKVRGRRVGPEAVRGRFPPEVPGRLRESSATGIALENLLLTPLREARDAAVARLRGQGAAVGLARPGR